VESRGCHHVRPKAWATVRATELGLVESRGQTVRFRHFEAGETSGLLHHLHGNHWAQVFVFKILQDEFGEKDPRKPFALWKWNRSLGRDEEDWKDFKTLIRGLTAFDPSTRLTAKEALEHSWFGDV
jgi:serine/threonine protein kinase